VPTAGVLFPCLPSVFTWGYACPTCQGDLRRCTASTLTEEEWQLAVTESQEIEFLLRPSTWETTDPTFIQRLGREFAILRQARNLKQLNVRNQSTLSSRTIEAVEYGRSGSKGTILRRYLEYASYLEVPLSQIFMSTLQREEGDQQINMLRGKLYLSSGGMVIKQVQEAAKQIEDAGECLTIKAICAMTGLSREGLYKHE
jgi:transcriptional regulator with XRE-family HTH domain